MKRAVFALVGLAALAGCGAAATKPVDPDEAAVRRVVQQLYEADANGDYATECQLMTDAARRRAVRTHAYGDPDRMSCEEAFTEEAKELEDLGGFLSDANKISRDTRVLSVAVGGDMATATVREGGIREPKTVQLERVGGQWFVSREAE